jgi:serine/threonine protein kinase
MAIFYKAYVPHLDRDMVIKVISFSAFLPDIIDRMINRFECEINILVRLNYPNIASVISFGGYEGTYYFMMPLLSGGTLKQDLVFFTTS